MYRYFRKNQPRLVWRSLLALLLLCAGTVEISGAFADEPVPLVAAIIPGSVEPDPLKGAIGLNVDLVRASFQKVGLATTIDILPWRRAKIIAEEGRAAALFMCSHRQERERHFHYSSKIRTVRTGIYALAENDRLKIQLLTDIRSKRLGVTAGYNLQDELDDVGIIYDRAPNDRELVAMLFARRSDYIYASEDIVAQILKRLNRSAQVRFFPLHTDDLFVCFSRKWRGFQDIANRFEQGLIGIRADGTFKRILSRYR